MKTKLISFFLFLGIVSQSQTLTVVNGNLKQPLGVATDPQGFLLVSDTGNNSIVKFNSVYDSSKIPGEPNLNNPRAIAKGYENIYIADGGNGVIKKINSSGSVIPLGYGHLSSPRGVAIDNAENVYVTSGSSVVRMNSDGTNITTLAAGMTSLDGIAVDYSGSTVYVSTGDGSVKKITNNGATVTTIASGLASPAGVGLDGNGNVFVAEYFGGSVKKITPAGVVSTYASGLQGPYGLAVGGTGIVFVTEAYTDQIRMLRTDGTSAIIKRFHLPTGIATDASGKIYTSDIIANTESIIKRMNSNGEAVTTMGWGYNSPYGIAINKATNNMIIANTYSNSVDLLNLGTGTGNPLMSGGIINRPHAVAVDSQNRVWIANTNNNNIVIYGGTSSGSIYANNGELYMPMGITVNGGHVFIADTGHQAIKRMTTAGSDITTIATGFSFPTGVLVDSSGKIYVADRGNNNNGKIVVLSNSGAVMATVTTGLLMPYSITFDANEDVLIADIGDGKIKKLNAVSLSVTEVSNESELRIYPNPTTNLVQISSTERVKSLALFDLSGKKIMERENAENEISLAGFSKGVYTMKIILENGITETRKIVKE